MADPDDLTGLYVQDVAASTQAEAAAAMLARYKRLKAGAKPAASGEAAAAPGGRLQFDPAAVRAGYGAIVGDIATGLTLDAGRAFVSGVRDGVQEAIDLGQSAGKWLDENVADVDLLASAGLPELGKFYSEGKLPEVDAPKSVTGGIIKSAVQFLTGFKGAGKVIKGAGHLASTAKGAVSTFAAFDGHEKNLANFWQEAGLPQNVLTDYLASSPDDTDMEGRFKNALADLGLSALIEPMTMGGRAVRTARLAKQKPFQTPDAKLESAALPQATNKDFDILGDVTQDKLRIKPKEFPETDFGVPTDVAAKGMVGSAKDAAFQARKSEEFIARPRGGASEFGGVKFPSEKEVRAIINQSDSKSARVYFDSDGELMGAWDARKGIHVDASPALGVKIDDSIPDAAQAGIAKIQDGRIVYAATNAKGYAEDVLGKTKGDFRPLGDYKEQYFPRAQIPQPHKPELRTNWARIDEPEDVKNVMAQLSDAFRPEIETARRGKVTFEQTKLDAAHESAWKILSERRQGDPLPAHKLLAARQLWAESTKKAYELGELAATNPSETNLFAFHKMVGIHRMIQQEVIAARTETARALASNRIPVSSDAIRHREINELLMSAGGPDTVRALAQRVSAAGKMGRADVLEHMVEKGVYAKTRDAVIEVWKAGLLWGLKTHGANFLSNHAVLAQQIGERAVAARVNRVLGRQDGVQMGEAAAMWTAYLDGVKDNLRYAATLGQQGKESGLAIAAKTMRTGKDELVLPGGKASSKALDADRPPAFSSQAFAGEKGNSLLFRPPNPNGKVETTWLGAGINGIGNTIRTSFRALAASDGFTKHSHFAMEKQAQALRLATQRVNEGSIPANMLQHERERILRDMPESLTLAAADQARYATFNNAPGDFAKQVMRWKEKYPALNVPFPFVRTQANLFTYAFQRTPFAPLFTKFREDFAAGGVRRDLAVTRMATGSLLMMTMADLAMSGHITGGGPSDTSKKNVDWRMNHQKYSIKMGDNYFQINRLDPVAKLATMAADAVELMQNTDWDSEDSKTVADLPYILVQAASNSVMSTTFMSSALGLVDAISDRSSGKLQRWIERTAGSVVPASAATVEGIMDPQLREVDGIIEAMKARTPGLSSTLEPRLDRWGREVTFESGAGWAYDAFSPIYYRRSNPEPIDLEIKKHEMSILDETRSQSFDGVRVNLDAVPGAYRRFVQLMGNDLELPRMGGMKDFLNAVVQRKPGFEKASQIYHDQRTDGPEGGKEGWVREVLALYRREAKIQLLDEFPALGELLDERKRRDAERATSSARPVVK